MTSPSSTSCGISTHTGPCGTVMASAHASWMADGMPEAWWTVNWALVTLRAEAFWSSSWCSMPLRRAPSPDNGICEAITSIGTPVA